MDKKVETRIHQHKEYIPRAQSNNYVQSTNDLMYTYSFIIKDSDHSDPAAKQISQNTCELTYTERVVVIYQIQ